MTIHEKQALQDEAQREADMLNRRVEVLVRDGKPSGDCRRRLGKLKLYADCLHRTPAASLDVRALRRDFPMFLP